MTTRRGGMTTTRTERVLRGLLSGVIVIAVIGAGLLIWNADSTELALFELLAFSVSIAALVLATLGAISNLHQVQTIRTISREMRSTLQELRDINQDTDTIKQKIAQDYALSKDIIEVLRDAKVGDDDAGRQRIADKIEHTVRRSKS